MLSIYRQITILFLFPRKIILGNFSHNIKSSTNAIRSSKHQDSLRKTSLSFNILGNILNCFLWRLLHQISPMAETVYLLVGSSKKVSLLLNTLEDWPTKANWKMVMLQFACTLSKWRVPGTMHWKTARHALRSMPTVSVARAIARCFWCLINVSSVLSWSPTRISLMVASWLGTTVVIM